MKKLLFSLSLLASLASVAGESSVDASAQVFGVLPITSCASNVIVCVPWRASSATDADIPVVDLIRTAELTAGDWIRVWDATAASGSGAFKVWQLDANKTWQPSTTVKSGVNGTIEASNSDAVARGNAVILYRQNPGTSANPATFYVQGQYLALNGETTTVALGSEATPAYTLIAPPIVSGSANLNSYTWNSGTSMTNDNILCNKQVSGKATDQIVSYQYKVANGWGYPRGKKTWVEPTIQAGVGCWYVSRGGQPTITWAAAK